METEKYTVQEELADLAEDVIGNNKSISHFKTSPYRYLYKMVWGAVLYVMYIDVTANEATMNDEELRVMLFSNRHKYNEVSNTMAKAIDPDRKRYER